MRACTVCAEVKPETDFTVRNSIARGRTARCNKCNAAAAAASRAKNPAPSRAATRRRNLERYGLTPCDYTRMLINQGGVCASCSAPPRVRALDVDHDHATGAVRGLLCTNCNRALGYLHDDPRKIDGLAAYARAHSCAAPTSSA